MKEKIVEELGKDIENKKRMSKEYEGKVNKRIFSNIIIAIVILLYLIILILGCKNIEADIFVVDLKVCSIILAMASILIFERSYKNSDGKLCIYGIEALIVAIFTLVSVYIFQIIGGLFTYIMCGAAIIVPIYYLIKSIGIYNKSKAEYINSQSDVKEIVKEELPETVETKRRRKSLEEQMEEYNSLYKQNNEVQEEINQEEYEEDEDDIDYYMYSTTTIENEKNYSRKKGEIFDEAKEEKDGYKSSINTEDDIFEYNNEENQIEDDDEDDYVERKKTKTNTSKIKKAETLDGQEEPIQAPKKRGRKPKNQINDKQEEPKTTKTTQTRKTTNKIKPENKTTTKKATTSKSTTKKSTTTKKVEESLEDKKEVKPRKKRTTKKEEE